LFYFVVDKGNRSIALFIAGSIVFQSN